MLAIVIHYDNSAWPLSTTAILVQILSLMSSYWLVGQVNWVFAKITFRFGPGRIEGAGDAIREIVSALSYFEDEWSTSTTTTQSQTSETGFT